MIARIPARSRREAMDWSLALLSQGIESSIDYSEETGWSLGVADSDYDRAVSNIQQYRRENLRWHWQQEISSEGILFDWASLAWVILVTVFYWLSTTRVALKLSGAMDSEAVTGGEWWRLFTAIFLHADLAHLASNAVFGFVLLGLAMGRFGTGVGLLAAFIAGAAGNASTWWLYDDHRSLGASGMVMGCLGLIAVQAAAFVRQHPRPWRYAITGMAAGAMLFVLFGTAPGTDVTAHFGGFVAGLLIGAALILFPPCSKGGRTNIAAGAVFCLFVIATWFLALRNV